MTKHNCYDECGHFSGMNKYYLYDNFSGEIREPKKIIDHRSNYVIRIGEWQNKIGEKKSFPIYIYSSNERILIDSKLILNLARIIKSLKPKGR